MGTYAFFKGKFVPLEEAKIGIITHAFNYGTACFEGIRANWNKEQGKFYVFRIREHLERLEQSCRIIKIKLPHSVAEMEKLVVQLVERCGYREDAYVRPMGYKSSEIVGVKLHGLEDDFLLFVVPFGPYLDVEKGARCCISSWRRIDDNMIPPRGKITGLYVNSALAKTEANENGFDEAIMLNSDGHVSEGSGENLFLVVNGSLITPAPTDNILMGITRNTIMELAKAEFGLDTVERCIDRSELYLADEVFMTGTAAHVTPVVEIDRRPVGKGGVGPVTHKLQKLYFDVIFGRNKKYLQWSTVISPRLVKV